MQISKKQLREFQRLYKKHYGEDISMEEAYDRGVRLIRFVQVVCGISLTAKEKKSQPGENFNNSLYYESFHN